MPGLLKRRLIFVTGKGGVGKSTVATALGMVAARRGLRTIVAELASQERVRQAFTQAGEAHGEVRADETHGEVRADETHGEVRSGETYAEVRLTDDLFTISIDPQSAMEEYLRVKTGPVGQALGSSRLFHAFAMATPGMRELLSMGKVWELAQHERRADDGDAYDLVIVDSPAAGHGVGILRTPRTFAEIARVGPIAHQARTIAATIADRDFTAVIAVATAAEMPVSETLWLRDALAADDIPLDAVIVNARYPERFSAADEGRLQRARAQAGSPLADAALGAALSERTRAQTQAEQLSRLRDGLGHELVELPYLFAEEVGRPELEALADALEAGLDKLPALISSASATG